MLAVVAAFVSWRVANPMALTRPGRVAATAVQVVALTALIAGSARWSEVDAGAPLDQSVTVVNYNIQSGFSRDDEFDLERQARLIEAQNPDVVVLQEVSRGWPVTTGVDQLSWLSRRLDMPYVWGPSAGDSLWGLAVLSRAPMHDADMTIYSVTNNLRRGVLSVRIETTSGDLWVFATHLDNGAKAADIRLQQVQELVQVWGGRAPAIIAGDFNASPSSDVVAVVTSAGFDDAGSRLGPDADSSGDGSRIDYIFASAGITVESVTMPDEWASDHLPIVATLTLPSALSRASVVDPDA
jgi:endonuclease/exonuclease/phosphatase family metal-dependent hydrolase